MKPADKLAPFYPYKPTSDLKNKKSKISGWSHGGYARLLYCLMVDPFMHVSVERYVSVVTGLIFSISPFGSRTSAHDLRRDSQKPQHTKLTYTYPLM